MSVSLLEIIAAAEARRAPVVGEMAGYVVLAVADQLIGAPRRIAAEQVALAEDGSCRVLGGAACTNGEAEAVLRGLLAALMDVASSGAPALRRAARRAPGAGLEGLIREIETGLIPVNRAAGRRTLSRLVRETLRAAAGGALDLDAARAVVGTFDARPASAPPPLPLQPVAARQAEGPTPAPAPSPARPAVLETPCSPVPSMTSATDAPPRPETPEYEELGDDDFADDLDVDLLSEPGASAGEPRAESETEAPNDGGGDDDAEGAFVVPPSDAEPPERTPALLALTSPEDPRGKHAQGQMPTPVLGTRVDSAPPPAAYAVCEAPLAPPLTYSEGDATERMPGVFAVDGALPDELPETFDADASVEPPPQDAASPSPYPSPTSQRTPPEPRVGARTPLGPEPCLRPLAMRAAFSSEAPPGIPVRQSDVSELLSKFEVAGAKSDDEVGRALKELAGVGATAPPPGVESVTPPPVVAGVEPGESAPTSSGQRGRGAMASIVGAVGAAALVLAGAASLRTSLSQAPPSAAGPTEAPSPACKAELTVVGAHETATIRVRGLAAGQLAAAKGPEAVFRDLPCQGPLDVLVSDATRTTWKRIPIEPRSLAPSAPGASVDLTIDAR